MMHLPNHWQYIAASYVLTLGCSLVLGVGAALRLRRSKARLAAIESQISRRERTAS
ncbi:hypothetical protein [Gluconobacter morbifer]|uniref:Heme exporter protein D n=1 Tax=Gluconobacter morbifer G707 TaxID=1088869 RepID=G6XFT0_9PROT|nr:hypothetical protein [Gluconobacter morbifer]EHH69038.1 hypothetical protein GMO_03450 [Gluconobacter morbifer G707]